MAVIMRHHPSWGLAIYDTASPQTPDNGPMQSPADYPTRVKFHSGLYYPSVAHQFQKTVTLPAQGDMNPGSGWSTGTHARHQITLGAHGQSGVPFVLGMLINHEGANRTLAGSFPVQTAGNLFRRIDLGVNGPNVVLYCSGFTQAYDGTFYTFPAIDVTVQVWVLRWVLGGDPRDYDPSLPLLKITSSRVQVGRGIFDSDREYIRSGTSTENTLLTRGETWTVHGANSVPSGTPPMPNWSWRYSVDGYTKMPATQGPGGSGTAQFTRVQLP